MFIEMKCMQSFAYELHLFGRFCASQKITQIGRNIFLLLEAISLCSLKKFHNGQIYSTTWLISFSRHEDEANMVMDSHGDKSGLLEMEAPVDVHPRMPLDVRRKEKRRKKSDSIELIERQASVEER